MKVAREHMLGRIREQREHIGLPNGRRITGLVGSVARGEAAEASDAEALADIVGMPSLFEVPWADAP